MLAAENNIPVILVNSVGQPVVKIAPVMSTGHTDLRKKQYQLSRGTKAVELIINMLVLKTEGQISNLAWWANRKTAVADICNSSKQQLKASIKTLLLKSVTPGGQEQFLQALRGWEGNNARYYWQAMAQLAQLEGWNMQGRSYHPALDEINSVINYMYGLLYHMVETALASNGLDSQIGLWHRDEYQTPSLSFDVIEPLRPKADQLVSEMIMQKQLQKDWFETDEKYGYILSRQGKAVIIQSFNARLEEKIKMQNEVTAFKNHILNQAYKLRQEIEKMAADE